MVGSDQFGNGDGCNTRGRTNYLATNMEPTPHLPLLISFPTTWDYSLLILKACVDDGCEKEGRGRGRGDGEEGELWTGSRQLERELAREYLKSVLI